MELQVIETIKQGFDIIKENPKIIAPMLIILLLNLYTSYTAKSLTESFMASSMLVGLGGINEGIDATEINESTALSQQANFSLMSIFLNLLNEFKFLIILFIVTAVASSLFCCMIIRMVYDSIKGSVSFKSAAKITIRKYIIVLLASIVFMCVVGLGFIALVIPGLYLLIKLFLFPYSILIGNKGIVGSLKESWNITKGNWWKIAKISGIFYVIIFVLNLIPIPYLSMIVIFMILTPWQFSTFTLVYLKLRRSAQGAASRSKPEHPTKEAENY